MKLITLHATAAMLMAFLIGCGIAEPDYRDYGEGDASGAETETVETVDGDATCEEQIAATFSIVQSTIDSTCGNAGCHGDGTGGGLTLEKGAAADNEGKLWSYSGGNASTLIAKLSDGSGHGGGTQVPTNLASSVISTWHTLKSTDCAASEDEE